MTWLLCSIHKSWPMTLNNGNFTTNKLKKIFVQECQLPIY